MELGEKLRKARLEAGLTQQALSAQIVTRNMLSLIENGSAQPSMSTLEQLARRLGKPISYFLEDEAAVSVNAGRMASARQLYDSGQPGAALEQLEGMELPDPVYGREHTLLKLLCLLELAEANLDRVPYALELLHRAEALQVPYLPELTSRRLYLQSRLTPLPETALPEIDALLLAHAHSAAAEKQWSRTVQLLEAVQLRDTRWAVLRGKAALAMEEYGTAARYLQQAEAEAPEVIPLLEQCFRELGDYKMAYHYACKGRQ